MHLRKRNIDGRYPPTPEEMARFLREKGLSEGEVLDLFAETAKATGGWTPELNKVGLLFLKPHAPQGDEVGA